MTDDRIIAPLSKETELIRSVFLAYEDASQAQKRYDVEVCHGRVVGVEESPNNEEHERMLLIPSYGICAFVGFLSAYEFTVSPTVICILTSAS
jgi:hypothetical protein